LLAAAWHDQGRDQHLHGLAVLIERGGPDFDQPLLRARLRRTHLEDLALEAQLIARTHRVRPAELVEAGADDAARGLELALDQEPHGERRRVPAARRQATEYAFAGGILIEMKRLRIELGGKALDPIAVDAGAAGAVGLANGKVLEISRGHFDASMSNAASCRRHGQLSRPKHAPPATTAVTIRPNAASA